MSFLGGFSNNKKLNKNDYIAITVFFILSLILTFSIEIIHRNDFETVFNWCISTPQIFLTNFILVFTIMVLLYSIFGCVYISSSIAYFSLLILSLASSYKEKFLGEPLFPSNLLLKKEGINIFPLLQNQIGFVILFIIILAAVLIFVLRFYLPKLKIGYVPRVIIGLFAFVILLNFSYIKPVPLRDFLSNGGMGEITWKQDDNYHKNGFVLSFLRNVKNSVISKPAGYSKNSIISAMNETTFDSTDNNQDSKSPNIIFVMSEAFWDPTVMESVTFSEDPIPTFRKLQKKYTSGWLLSPVYGGLTANVEFEVLTGNSVSFLPQGSVPYQQFIKGPTLSLASILKGQGYYAAAVHSYFGWFWNRNSVYKNMGFDTFISSEGMKNAKHKGAYISDSEVSKEIIKLVNDNEQPVFIYSVTMQNHGPYDNKRYKTNQIEVSGNITEKSKELLETYAQGLKDADQSLKALVDYADKIKEPTMIVFFGDHMPLLGDNYSVYKDAGYLSSGDSLKWSLNDYKKMRSVPVVIWTNYKQEKKVIKDMSDSFLGLYALKMAGKQIPAYFNFVDMVYRTLPGFIYELKIDSEGNLHAGDDAKHKKLMNEYWLMQYDRMFGKKIQDKY